MHLVDGIVLIIILLSVLIGIFRGFVKETIALVAWIAAIWIAMKFCEPASAYVPAGVETSWIRLAIAFGVLFILTLIVGGIFNFVVNQLVSKTGLSGTDRILGFIFGAFRGAVIITVIVMLASSFTDMEEEPWWKTSVSLPYFETLSDQLKTYLPVSLQERLDPPSLREPAEGQEQDSDIPGGEAVSAPEAAADLLKDLGSKALEAAGDQLPQAEPQE